MTLLKVVLTYLIYPDRLDKRFATGTLRNLRNTTHNNENQNYCSLVCHKQYCLQVFFVSAVAVLALVPVCLSAQEGNLAVNADPMELSTVRILYINCIIGIEEDTSKMTFAFISNSIINKIIVFLKADRPDRK